MKKLVSITIIVALCVLMCACSTTTVAPPLEEETTTHTLPPTQSETAEPEWAEVDSDIILSSGEEIVVGTQDFETFALMGSNDEDSYIILKVNDSGHKNILEYTSITSNTLYLYLNGEEIEELTIDPYTDDVPMTIEFGHDKSYEELCELASIIRGLF